MDDWKTLLKGADVNVDDAIARFCGREDRYIKYLKLFYEDKNYEELVEALDQNEVKTAFDRCHTLKGVVGNLGFRTMFPNVYEACEKLRMGETNGVKDLVNEVEFNYNEIKQIIGDNLM